MIEHRTPAQRRCMRLVALGLAVLAGAWAVWSIGVILDSGLRYPAFDQYHFYPRYLGTPFPRAAFELENGHRPVLPGLVRMAEVAWTGAGQMLQIGIGLVFVVLTVVLIALAGRRDGRSAVQACTTWLLVVLAVLWLANARMLIHGNEILALYLVTGFTVAALWTVHAATGPHAVGCMAVAGLCALAAVFSFGSGMAAFIAVFAMAWVARVRWRAWLAPMLLFACALGLYVFGMPGDSGVRNSLSFAPAANLMIGLEWLSAPWVHAWFRYVEPSPFAWHEAQGSGNVIEAALRGSANLLQALLGAHALRIEQILIGAGGLLAWVACLGHARRHAGPLPRGRLVALGVASFGLAVGALICLARLGHFEAHPADVLAERYLPWSTLFWLGLALYAVAAPCMRSQRRELGAAALAIALAVVLVPSQRWWAGWAAAVYRSNQASAVAAQMDIHDPARFPDGLDASADDVRRTLAMMRERGLSMFGEPGYALWASGWRPPVTLMPPQPGLWLRPDDGFRDDSGLRVVRIEGVLPRRSAMHHDSLIVFVDAARNLRGMAKPTFDDVENGSLHLFAPDRRGFDGYLIEPKRGESFDALLVDPATRAVLARYPVPDADPA